MIYLTPIKNEHCNFIFYKPGGMENCENLHVYKHEEGSTSFWEVPGLGTVNLTIFGQGMPPVALQFEKEESVKHAIDVLTEALRTDEAYRRSWKDNIAMAFKDVSARYDGSETDHVVANEAADNFLTLLCRK